MAMNGYADVELDLMCDGLFDNIEDLLDFSTDDEAFGAPADSSAAVTAGGGGGHAYQQVAPPPANAASVTISSDVNKICDEVNISEDWIADFLDDSNFDIDFPATAAAINAAAAAPMEEDSLFRSFSPVSVLEESNNLSGSEKTGGSSSYSSSSSSSANSGSGSETACLAPVGPTMMLVPGRARSKRPRRAAPVTAHATAPIVPPASDGPPAVPTMLMLPLPECESYGESSCPVPTMRKKKKKSHSVTGAAGGEEGVGARRCQHCGIQKTPQWRAGPTGPKTLCNACGVRYKSGRLFPEYRPAASPTFVPSIHSNSHKKVVEIRNKVCQQDPARPPANPAAKNCDLLAYIRAPE